MDNSISLNISKQAYSQRRIVRNNLEHVDDQHYHLTESQQMQEEFHNSQHINKKIIMLSTRFNIFLGPNYAFFILGFTMVLTVTFILLYCSFALIKNQSQQQSTSFNKVIRAAAVFMATWVNLTYLITALSDPGVYRPGKVAIKQKDNLRYCSACKFKIPNNVRHCIICDVCIIDLDHHCPWMSKCVGKNNLKAFYGFIGGVFVMMGLFWLTIFIMLTQ